LAGFREVDALSAFPPSWWRRREAADSEESQPGGGHRPHVRTARSSWRQDASGQWESDAEEAHLWEVFCQQCGDTDGPVDIQPEAARRLRGPYPSMRRAGRAAVKHLKEYADRRP
jgi:hypothetical protein